MFSILLANNKGGCGKSTLATNLAGYYANAGRKVMLGDVDRQQSALLWLDKRPKNVVGITGWQLNADEAVKPPQNTEIVVLDSQAGLHGKKLTALLEKVDRVIVPVQPSPFDMAASKLFIKLLMNEKRVRKGKVFVGFVGVRVDPRTKSAQELERFLQLYDLPVLTWLRDTQLYVQLAFRGLTLFDFAVSNRVSRDVAEWQSILAWLKEGETLK